MVTIKSNKISLEMNCKTCKTNLIRFILIMLLNLLCWNSRGIMSSAFSLSEYLDSYDIDIALISEHKLFPKSATFLESINQSYSAFATFDCSLDQYGPLRCGRAGTAVLYKKALNGSINRLPVQSDRIIGIELYCNNTAPLYILCTYLPACQNVSLYKSVLSDLESLINQYTKLGNVIVGGDFNGQILNDCTAGNAKSKLLTSMINRNNFTSVKYMLGSDTDFTFIPNKTTIDHVLVDVDSRHNVISYHVLDSSEVPTSDHKPIIVTYQAECRYTKHNPPMYTLSWDKCTQENLTAYQQVLNQELNCILNINCDKCEPDFLNTIIVNAIKAAEHQIPRSRFNPSAKPYWNKDVKATHVIMKQWRREWLNENQPRYADNITYARYKQAKADFRRTQRRAVLENENKKLDELTRTSELDYKQFWKILKKRSGKSNNSVTEILVNDERFSDENIANGFSQYFKHVFSVEPGVTSDDREVFEGLNRFLTTECLDPILVTPFNQSEIKSAIKCLNKHKAPGIDNVLNEHIINGGDKLVYAVTALFNSSLYHERLPQTWKTSVLVPIFKGNGKSKKDPSNYRPVSLIPCLCKLFEKLLLQRVLFYLKSNSIPFPNNQQQGFQKGFSCITTCFNFQETIYKQIESGSNAYVACLDQRAAFDSVWHTGLLYKLGTIGFTGKILRTVMDMYSGLKCVVRSNGTTSTALNIARSVRQGGVLSTFLYLVYIDQLLNDLEESNYGCMVHSVKGGNPSFADDISLIANTPLRLQRLVDIVLRYCRKWKIEMNADKSNTIVFTKKRSAPRICIMYGDKNIKQADHVIHLGIRHDFNLVLTRRIDERLQKARNSFYTMASLGVTPDGVNPLTSINIYSKIVKPIALYGCELWCNLPPSCTTIINRFQHFVVKKIQGFQPRTRSDMAEAMVGLHKLTCDISVRKLMFLHKILSLNTNSTCRNIFLTRYLSYASEKNSVTLGFIPDICGIMHHYGLDSFVNSVLINPTSLPTKYAWKQLVKRLVYSLDEQQWYRRISLSDEFDYFKKLCPMVQQSIVYIVCKYSCTRAIMKTVSQAWCEPTQKEVTECKKCLKLYNNRLVHSISECDSTEQLRGAFLQHTLWNFGSDFVSQLISQDNVNFSLRLLGAPILPFIEKTANDEFLHRSFRFVHDCICIQNH